MLVGLGRLFTHQTALLDSLAPGGSAYLKKLLAALLKKSSALLTIHHQNQSSHPAFSIMWGRTAGSHIDKNNNLYIMDFLLTAGVYKGGNLFFSQLGAEFPYPPGSGVAFHGGAFLHGVCPHTGPHPKSQICVASYIHDVVIQEIATKIPDEFRGAPLDQFSLWLHNGHPVIHLP